MKQRRSGCPGRLVWVVLVGLLLGCANNGTGSDDGSPGAARSATPATPSSLAKEAPGTVYYVAANERGASDKNNGLSPSYQGGADGPWATVHHAASTMLAGDTTYVRAGTYYEQAIPFAHAGSPQAPITLAAYEREQVILDGSQGRGRSSGIEIAGGAGNLVFDGLTIRNMPRSGITTDSQTREVYRNITIRNCIVHDNGLSGIRLAAVDGFLVQNIEAYGNGFYGLNILGSEEGALSAANGLVQASTFHHHTGKEGHGLAINQGHDIIVRDSLAYHNTLHGFDVSDWPKGGDLSHRVLFEGNQSYDNGVAGFAINSDSHHVTYRYNVAFGNGADWAGRGSSVVEGGQWQVVATHNDWAGEPGRNARVVGIRIVGDEGEVYTSDDLNRGDFQTGNISVDPLFVDLDVPDVRLQPGSPCIDAGEDVGLPYLGTSPDMGAFEFESMP